MIELLSCLTLVAAMSAPAGTPAAAMHGAIIGLVAVPRSQPHRELLVALGDRVRIDAPSLPEPLFGRVTNVEPGAEIIVVATPAGHAQVTLPLSAVRRIDVSRGRARSKTALFAGAAGLAVGGGIGAGAAGAVGAVAFGGTGFAFSAIAGVAYAPERWRVGYERDRTSDGPVRVAVATNARVKHFPDGTIGVGGERNRRRGMVRGSVLLGAVAAVFGGLDRRQGQSRTGEYIGTIAGNLVVGAALGYLISPRRWQRLPSVKDAIEHQVGAATSGRIGAEDGVGGQAARRARVLR